MTRTKICTKCGDEHPATTEYFYAHKFTKDGLLAKCKKCCADYQRNYHQNHQQQRRKYQQKYHQEHRQECFKRVEKYRQTLKGCLGRMFSNMNQRCNNLKHISYKNYGGRGIKCLFKSLDTFRDYVIDILGYDTYEKIKGLQIDRINNNGHYKCGNIRFVTHKENCNNQRT